MTILFTCPYCSTKSQVADQFAGQSGPCAACGKTVTIPYPGSASSKGGGGGAAMTIMIVLGLVGGLMVLCVCGGVGLFYTARQGVVGASSRMQSQNNLRQIGLALMNYHDANGSFPPAVVKDESGKPLYSWRVLILPYLEEGALFNQWNKNEPWDSPNNLALSQRMPRVFQSPNHVGGGSTTDYAAFVGPETLWDPNRLDKKGTRMAEITDGTSNTIMVTEIKNSNINWAEPRDIEFSKSTFVVNAANNDIGGNSGTNCNVLWADGTVRSITSKIPAGTLRSMVTKAGGEVVTMDGF